MTDHDASPRGADTLTTAAPPIALEGIGPSDAPVALTRLFVSVDALFSQLRRRLDLGPNERLAIEYLWEYGPMAMSELADRLAVTRAAVTTLVDRMAEMDLVSRHPDMHDRRRTIVSVSECGIHRCCDAVQPWHGAMAELADGLTTEQWAVIQPFLIDLHTATRAEADRQRGISTSV